MKKLPLRHLGWSSLVLIGLTGCPPTEAPTPAPGDSKAASPAKPAASDADKGKETMPVDPSKPADPGKPENNPTAKVEPAKLTDKEIVEIKKLPAEEQTIAMAQMTCPVSGSLLGSMDKPIKQVVDGKTFFLCCEGCEDKVKEDPKGVLAKLEKK